MSRLVTSTVALAGVAALAGSVAWIFSIDQALSSAPTVQATAAPRAASAPAPATAPHAPAASTQARTDATPSATPSATAAATPASAPQAQAATAPAPGSAGQRVSIDPKTGALRPIEHDEAAALATASAAQTRGARKTSLAEPQQSFGPGGSVTVDIPEDLHTYSVATRRPDGSIAVEHATGPTAAKSKVKAGATLKKRSTPAVQEKEDRDDR